MARQSNKPVWVFRFRGISASVFENRAQSEGREVTFHKVSVQRSYRNGDDFKSTTSFSRDDLPIVKLVIDQAWQYILEVEDARGKYTAKE